METETIFELSESLKNEIISEIEKNQPEMYWDYNDGLSKENIEKIFSEENGLNELENELWELNIDYICDLEAERCKELISEFEERINEELGTEDSEEWEEEFRDFAREYICVDMDLKGLMRNNRDEVFFYDTCEEFGDQCFNSAMDKYNDLRRIKKTLGIKTNKFDAKVRELLNNASYGGNLVVYFAADVMTLRDCVFSKEKQFITFKGNVSIAITNTCNGSGHDVEIQHSFKLPFNPDNLFYEDTIKYNYSWAVCGMSRDWCNGTDWGFELATKKVETKESSLNASIAKDREYKRIFASGKCTFGDMDINRHRRVSYVNEYPCGNRCPDCGTFWID